MTIESGVADLHCDLLSYLLDIPGAGPLNRDDIGCALPWLREGNVKLQIMAIYSHTGPGSAESGLQQSAIYRELLATNNDLIVPAVVSGKLAEDVTSTRTSVIAAIENASGFCGEDEDLERGFSRLEEIMQNTGRILYISLTHHGENRFGGGNASKTGLKKDGRVLLNYISGRKIAIDLSHASDALAYEVLDCISKTGLDIPVLASHSNLRKIWDHPRNLPDEIAKEIINRKGLIGINFLRAFLNDREPDAIYDHILHGINLGGRHCICFGADYFYTACHPDQSRIPFFFKEHQNAASYPSILKILRQKIGPEMTECIGSRNTLEFIKRVWTDY